MMKKLAAFIITALIAAVFWAEFFVTAAHAGMLVTTSADYVWNLNVTTIDTTYSSTPVSAVIVSARQVQEYVKNPDNVTSTLHMYRHLPSSGLTVPSKVKLSLPTQN